MTSFLKKTMLYLGLGSDEDFQEMHDSRGGPPVGATPAPQTSGVTTVRPIPKSEDTGQSRLANAVRTIAPPKVSKPCVVTPIRFSDVKEISEAIKRRQPVIVNIQQAEHDVAVRVIDFCSGLKVGIEGGFVKAGDDVFLLTPKDVEVSDEERQRLGGSISA
ncbi:MAG: hypothetical protein CL470_03720 [Acidimicrobiaceae bacterium]|nr:hypothetical protein [Acidimicrobiaceae bacterium]|tara:strand:- start:34 stop:516 length:483 start_codon:yes stop_codon:yes gene_type:complete